MAKKRVKGSHRTWWLSRRDQRLQRSHLFEAGRRRRRTRRLGVQRGTRTSVLAMPAHLIVEKDDQRAKLRRVLDSADSVLSQPRTKVKFDFSRVAKIYPGGMLVFIAHLYLLAQIYPGRVAVRAPSGSVASQLLEHVGVYSMLGAPRAGPAPNHESVVNWRYLTGTGSDGVLISELLASYKDQIDAEIPEGLYDVLAEAFTNVRHHAFPAASRVPEFLKRWWLFSRYVAPKAGSRGALYIAVYDIGVGIQNSLRHKLRTGEWILDATDELLSVGGRLLERKLLETAVEHERSRTGLKNRGLGLPEMKEFVMSTDGGRLYILSGSAQYSCSAGAGKGTVYDCANGFGGTLILWSLPLTPKESA